MNDKHLRQNIVAIAFKKYNWDMNILHDVMKEWGFGDSLRKLSTANLIVLRNILKNQDYTIENEEWKLDGQGRYMWYLMKQLGWGQKEITSLMIKKCHKTHWNSLEKWQKRQIINILKVYTKKNTPSSSGHPSTEGN